MCGDRFLAYYSEGGVPLAFSVWRPGLPLTINSAQDRPPRQTSRSVSASTIPEDLQMGSTPPCCAECPPPGPAVYG